MDERDRDCLDVDRIGKPRELVADGAAQRAGPSSGGGRVVIVAVIGILAAWAVAAIVIRDNIRLRAVLDQWAGYAQPNKSAAVSRVQR